LRFIKRKFNKKRPTLVGQRDFPPWENPPAINFTHCWQ